MKPRILLILIVLGFYNASYAVLTTPTQLAPTNGAINQDVNALLDWSAITGSTGYNYQYDTSPAFNSPNFFISNSLLYSNANLTFGLGTLNPSTTYYWRATWTQRSRQFTLGNSFYI